MYKILRFFAGILCGFFIIPVNANVCLSYKVKPKIIINPPDYTIEVVQPRKQMDLLHGNVVATLVNNYDIVADVIPVGDGYCVGIKSIDATIGYSDFLVKIDSRHNPNSCSYNAILSHENKHIDAYLSVIYNNKYELYNALYSAADSIIPMFVKEQSDIENTVEKLNDELQSHPDIVLVIQKIHADEEIRNKSIDRQEDYSELKKCL